ncbi:MAG: WYL domain-containing protein [Acidimicrobiales bacterium]|nr:WYL domain-containing protein [Acidimicrobiales bacterium]
MAANKLERILTLTHILLETPRHLTAVEIRSRVPGYPSEEESFRRSFERDKAELRSMGIPLDVDNVPGTDPPILGYRIPPGEGTLRDPGLAPDELDALRLAVAVIGSGDGTGQRALLKLGGGVTPDTAGGLLVSDPAIEAAFEGLAERRRLSFRYHDVDRDVDPYRLQFARNRWYLVGFDHSRGALRWFRLDRVQGEVTAGPTPGAFERPEGETPGLQLAPWLVGGDTDETVTARVWFDPDIAAYVRAGLGDVEVVGDDSDGLVVELPVTNREGFRSWVMSYLDRAEVLGPASLRDEVVDWLTEVAE